MKKLYWVFLGFLIIGLSSVVAYFGFQPRAILKIKPSQFESLAVAGNSVALRLNQEVRGASILILGVMEPTAVSLEIWANMLRSSSSDGSWPFRLILPDFFQEEIEAFKWVMDLEPSFVVPENLLTEILATRKAGQKVLIIMPSVMSSRLAPRQQITDLQANIPEPITTISLVPLAVNREGLEELPYCEGGITSGTTVSNLGCAIQHQSRLILRKNFPPDQLVGTLAQFGATEYLFFLHLPDLMEKE